MTITRPTTAHACVLGLALAGAVTASCSKEPAPPAAATPAVSASAAVGANGEKYPEPRWPSYFKTPRLRGMRATLCYAVRFVCLPSSIPCVWENEAAQRVPAFSEGADQTIRNVSVPRA